MKRFIATICVSALLLCQTNVFAQSIAATQTYSTGSLKNERIFEAYSLSGTFSDSSLKNYNGERTKFSNTKGDRVQYALTDIKAGNYEVYYWVIPHLKDNAGGFRVEIQHNGKTDTVAVQSKLEDGETVAPGWFSVGVFDFSGNNENIYAYAPSGNVCATAVRLVPTQKELSVIEPLPEETEKKPSVLPLSGYTRRSQGWRFSSAVPGPAENTKFTLWIAHADQSSHVTYYPQITQSGMVDVSVYLLYWAVNQAPQVNYEVHHNGKTDVVTLDPTSITESQWVSLGKFDFAGTPETEFVKLVCVPQPEISLNTRASALSFKLENGETLYTCPVQDKESELYYGYDSGLLAPLNTFKDMQNHWAQKDVEYLANEGLISGVADGVFDPEANITRAEYITILDRAMGYTVSSGESYADVAQDMWYAPFVATAKTNGLLNGLPTQDGFKPEQPITREEMALFTYNAIKATKKNDQWVSSLPTAWESFTDKETVSDWAKESLQYLIQTGIIKGTSDTTVSPAENATRAQGAVVLKRFMQQFVWAGPRTDAEWELTFHDEFSGTSPNWDVWASQASTATHILSSRWPENVEVKDGDIKLLNKKENRGGQEYTTANIWVKPEVFRQSYGYWEARYKIADSTGVNNSFWMITQVIRIPDDTYKFEIDVNEGKFPNIIDTNYHNSSTGTAVASGVRTLAQYVLSEDYHTYGLKWNEKELIYYFDGKEIDRKANVNAHIPLFPYLSTAITEHSGQPEQSGGTAMEVDYVRVWQYNEYADDAEKTMIQSGNLNMPGTPADVIPVSLIDAQVPDNQTYPDEMILDPVNENGEWLTTNAVRNYNGGPHYWCKDKDATSTYYLENVPAGKYKVFFWRTPHPSTVEKMTLYLHSADTKTALEPVAMRSAEVGSSEPGWIEIGTIELTGNNEKIVYTCVNGGNRASGLKLVPVK